MTASTPPSDPQETPARALTIDDLFEKYRFDPDAALPPAMTAIKILLDFRFDLTRTTPAEVDDHAVQALAIAKAVCDGADLDDLAAFPQDFIYKKQSLLHLMAWTRSTLYANGAYAAVEDALDILTRPNPATGACRFDLDQIDGVWGYTPLHYAAAFGSARLCQVLLEAGATLDVRSTGGMYPGMLAHRTPLSIAQAEGRNSIIQVISAWRANQVTLGVLKAAGARSSRHD